MTTLYEAKGQARRLAEYLSSLDLTLNHGQALEAVARSHGAPSWNVFSSQTVASEATSDAAADLPLAPRHTSSAAKELLTLRGLLAHATSHEYGPVHIRARSDATTIYQRIRGRLLEIAQLDAANTMDFAYNLGRAREQTPNKVYISGVGEVTYGHHELPVMGGRDIVIRAHRLKEAHELGLTEMRKWVKMMQGSAGLVLIAGHSDSGHDILGATLGVGRVGETDIIFHKLTDKNGTWIEVPGIRDDKHFQEHLNLVMRSDPHAVITNLGTEENLQMALDLANTGHFVVATVDGAANPVEAVRRLLSFGNASKGTQTEIMLQQTLKGILSQLKVNPSCEDCGGTGCSHCFGTGRGPDEYLSALWTPQQGWSVDDLLNGKLTYRTVPDDVKVKEASGMIFPTETLSFIESHASVALQ